MAKTKTLKTPQSIDVRLAKKAELADKIGECSRYITQLKKLLLDEQESNKLLTEELNQLKEHCTMQHSEIIRHDLRHSDEFEVVDGRMGKVEEAVETIRKILSAQD